jgi:ribosomal protein S18 acetylase RimI-like enzyme
VTHDERPRGISGHAERSEKELHGRTELRPATDADSDFLRNLHHLVYRDVVTRQFGKWDEKEQDQWFEKALTEGQYWVIEQNGQAIGAVGTSEEAEYFSLVELLVLPEWQNKGIGTAILKQQLERASLLKRREVHLRVLRENQARRLYERHGFVVTGETDTHYLMILGLG